MFSIIIPLYNRETFITETLNSVIQQTFSNWECIVVDDGSTDNSIQIVKKFEAQEPRIKLIQRDREPKNANTCRNIGIENSSGDFLIFLDSDDLLLPHCLEQRKKLLKKYNEINLLITGTGSLDRLSKSEHKLYGSLYSPDTNFLDLFISLHSPWYMSSGTWEKEFISKVGNFDEKLLRLQDPDIHIRALLHSDLNLLYQYQEIDHTYRIHSQRRFSSNDIIQIRINGYLAFFRKYTNFPDVDQQILEAGVNKTIVEFLYSNKESHQEFDALCLHYYDALLDLGLINKYKHKYVLGLNRVLQYIPKFRGLGKLLYFLTNALPKIS